MRNTPTRLISVLLLMSATFASFASSTTTSQSAASPAGMAPTFFRVRNISTDSTFELAQMNYMMFNNKHKCWGDFWARPFYQQNFYPAQTARYFMPNGNDRARLATTGVADVNPTWLQLVPPATPDTSSYYFSQVAVAPLRQTYGAIFSLNFYPWDCVWLGLHGAVVHAVHNMRVNETGIISSGANVVDGVTINNFCAAMTAPNLTFGRIPCQKVATTGFDDLQVKLGYNFVDSDNGHFALYLIGTAPTARRKLYRSLADTSSSSTVNSTTSTLQPQYGAQYLFQPQVGQVQGSFGAGLNADVLLYELPDRCLHWMWDVKFNYYFRAKEQRSFDLTLNGNWSRYLLLVPETARLSTVPAINSFTMDANVRPGAQVQGWTALHYEYCGWHLEGGYNCWFREQERIDILSNPNFPVNYGIADLAGIQAGAATSASLSTINLSGIQIPSDAAFQAVQISDLNATSAAHPRTASSKFYGSLAANFENCGCDYFVGHVGINGSVEFAHNYAAMNQYAFWATLALLF